MPDGVVDQVPDHPLQQLRVPGCLGRVKQRVDAQVQAFDLGSGDAAAYLEIANSGPVIPDDAVPSLFEPFRRMQARTGVRDGAGLGLSIARSVVTAHRAALTARSQPADGLDISVVIPRCLAVEPHLPVGPQP